MIIFPWCHWPSLTGWPSPAVAVTIIIGHGLIVMIIFPWYHWPSLTGWPSPAVAVIGRGCSWNCDQEHCTSTSRSSASISENICLEYQTPWQWYEITRMRLTSPKVMQVFHNQLIQHPPVSNVYPQSISTWRCVTYTVYQELESIAHQLMSRAGPLFHNFCFDKSWQCSIGRQIA